MKKLWNDWSGPVAFTLGWTLLLAAALLMPNVPVWADPGIGEGTACSGCTTCNNIDNNGNCVAVICPTGTNCGEDCICQSTYEGSNKCKCKI